MELKIPPPFYMLSFFLITPDKSFQLVVHGLYWYTRNPMYFGLRLILVGWALYLGAVSAFFILSFFIFTLNFFQIKPEERVLERFFGDEYRTYKNKVRCWI